MSDIWGIILAAGESKRMGTPKMLLPFKGKTILECVIDRVTGSEVDEIIVVTGSGRPGILKIIGTLPVKNCYNESYKQGMLSSVKCGFRSLPDGFGAGMIFLGDQPMIETPVINRIIEAFRNSRKGIVMPVFGNKRGHPLLISSKYRHEIEKLEDNGGLRILAQKFPDDVLEVEVNTNTILKDIDTEDDYTSELN